MAEYTERDCKVLEDLSLSEIAEAFNEWLRRTIEDPQGFEREWQIVQRYQQENLNLLLVDEEPSHGFNCTSYLISVVRDLRAKQEPTIAPVGDAPAVPAADPGADLPEPQED